MQCSPYCYSYWGCLMGSIAEVKWYHDGNSNSNVLLRRDQGSPFWMNDGWRKVFTKSFKPLRTESFSIICCTGQSWKGKWVVRLNSPTTPFRYWTSCETRESKIQTMQPSRPVACKYVIHFKRQIQNCKGSLLQVLSKGASGDVFKNEWQRGLLENNL